MAAYVSCGQSGAVGKRLQDLFPSDLAEQFERVRGEIGIHHIYKFKVAHASWPARSLEAAIAANGNGRSNGGSNGHAPAPPRETTLGRSHSVGLEI